MRGLMKNIGIATHDVVAFIFRRDHPYQPVVNATSEELLGEARDASARVAVRIEVSETLLSQHRSGLSRGEEVVFGPLAEDPSNPVSPSFSTTVRVDSIRKAGAEMTCSAAGASHDVRGFFGEWIQTDCRTPSGHPLFVLVEPI